MVTKKGGGGVTGNGVGNARERHVVP